MTVRLRRTARIHSYADPAACLEDFDTATAAITEAVGLPAPDQAAVLGATRARIAAGDLGQQALSGLVRHGERTGDWAPFGLVALFSMDAGTALSAACEVLVSVYAREGGDVRLLGWPEEPHPANAVGWDPAVEAVWDSAVEEFKAAHAHVPTKNYTVVGYWSGDEVTIIGIVEGVHEVFGGTDETGDGLFADSFSVPEDADDVEAALREAVAAEYYDK